MIVDLYPVHQGTGSYDDRNALHRRGNNCVEKACVAIRVIKQDEIGAASILGFVEKTAVRVDLEHEQFAFVVRASHRFMNTSKPRSASSIMRFTDVSFSSP